MESEKTRLRLEKAGYGAEIFTLRQMNFAQLDQVAPGVLFDFVLADLGVSLHADRRPRPGLHLPGGRPAGLRLNQQAGVPAAQRLAGMGQEELAALLRENADEPYADPLAKAIFHKVKRGGGIRTTKELAQVVEPGPGFPAPPRRGKRGYGRPASGVFQALRIDVNGEYEALYQFLEKLPGVLKPGGKAAILTFHSGEDRLVKKSFQALARAGVYEAVAREVIRPSLQEQGRNPRARSAKLRWAVRSQDPPPSLRSKQRKHAHDITGFTRRFLRRHHRSGGERGSLRQHFLDMGVIPGAEVTPHPVRPHGGPHGAADPRL